MANTLDRYDELSAQGYSMRVIADMIGVKYDSLRDSVRRRERKAKTARKRAA